MRPRRSSRPVRCSPCDESARCCIARRWLAGGTMTIGRTRWAIAEGYIPAWSHGKQPEMLSHETVCVLNAGETDAHVSITLFFTDREPAGPYLVTVPARRTRHVRFND